MSKGFTGVVEGRRHSSEGGDDWGGAAVSWFSAAEGSPGVICILGGVFLVSGLCGREAGLAAGVE